MATYTLHTGILEVIVPQTDSYFHFFLSIVPPRKLKEQFSFLPK